MPVERRGPPPPPTLAGRAGCRAPAMLARPRSGTASGRRSAGSPSSSLGSVAATERVSERARACACGAFQKAAPLYLALRRAVEGRRTGRGTEDGTFSRPSSYGHVCVRARVCLSLRTRILELEAIAGGTTRCGMHCLQLCGGQPCNSVDLSMAHSCGVPHHCWLSHFQMYTCE